MKSSKEKDNIIKINIGANGRTDRLVVYFNNSSTKEFDGKFDAFRHFSYPTSSEETQYQWSVYKDNWEIPHIYSLTEKNVMLAINALPESEMNNLVIPIGMRVATSGEYTISKEQILTPGYHVYLVDKSTGEEIYMNTEDSYKFNLPYTEPTDIKDRFELRLFKNNAPIVDSPINKKVTYEKNQLKYTFSENTFIELDKNDAIVSYEASLSNEKELPEWLSFNPSSKTFSGVPQNDDVGSIVIRLKAIDKLGAVGQHDFILEVANVNDAPELVSSVPNQQADEDLNFSFSIPTSTFKDIDVNDVLTISANLADGASLPGWLTFNPVTNSFEGLPGNGDVGVISVKLTATDQYGANVSDNFSIEVINVNDAPELVTSLPDQEVIEGTYYSYTLPTNTFNINIGKCISW
jgi:hypothetical protein